jgi:hypothetical protein
LTVSATKISSRGSILSTSYPIQDPDTDKTLVFLTNNVTLLAASIYAIYDARGQAELFVTWIKQHLRIKRFLAATTKPNRTTTATKSI